MGRFLTRRRMLAAGAGVGAAVPAALAGGATAGAVTPQRTGPVNVPLVAQRVFDSREPNPLTDGDRLQSGETVIVNIGSGDGFDLSLGVFVNCTITQTVGRGWLTLFPSLTDDDSPVPETSNVNWSTSDQTLANLVLCAVGSENSIEVRCQGAGSTHFILDVQGYVPFTPI